MRRWTICVVLATFAVLTSPRIGAPKDPEPLPALNAKVFEFSRANLGKSVGNGSCITLAIQALQSAGARRVPLDDPKGDYAWGEPILDFKDVLPGDILQFRDAVFHGQRSIGGGKTARWHHEYHHHTAVVAKVERAGQLITVYHQNVTVKGQDPSTKETVQEGELRMDSLQKGGWVKAYRPVPADRPLDRKPFNQDDNPAP